MVTKRNGSLYVDDTRVSLTSIYYEWDNGQTATEIQESFPALTIDQVEGAIAFCRTHPEEVAADIAYREEKWRILS